MQIFSMPEGRYFIGKVSSATVLDIPEAQALTFTVLAGKMTYGGHIAIPSALKNRTALVGEPIVKDRSDEAQLEIKLLYPWMAKYEYVKTLARAVTSTRHRSPSIAGLQDLTLMTVPPAGD